MCVFSFVCLCCFSLRLFLIEVVGAMLCWVLMLFKFSMTLCITVAVVLCAVGVSSYSSVHMCCLLLLV